VLSDSFEFIGAIEISLSIYLLWVLRYETMRYDMVGVYACAHKLTVSPFNLAHKANKSIDKHFFYKRTKTICSEEAVTESP